MLIGTMVEQPSARTEESATLKIGLLMDFSGRSGETSRDSQRAFELAIKRVNGGGGVLGLPVAVAVGDTTADSEVAAAEARRFIEVEGAHVIVGPNSCANALPIAERVVGPAGSRPSPGRNRSARHTPRAARCGPHPPGPAPCAHS